MKKTIQYFFALTLTMMLAAAANALAPSNADCSGAILLTPSVSCNPVAGVSYQGGVSTTTTCGAGGDNDVWYKFVATDANPTITVNFVGGGAIASLDLRSGACNGTNIACAYSEVNVLSLTASGLTLGTTYHIMLNVSGAALDFTICVTNPPVANDDCSNAITLTPAASCIPVSGTTILATQSIPAITCSGNTGDADDDVWYKFTAINTSAAITVTGNIDFDPVIDLRDGCTGNNIACADANGVNLPETLNATGLTIGTIYYIRVYGYWSGFPKPFTICVVQSCTPHAYNVTGGGVFCTGGSGIPIGLDGSDIGINYQLYRNASPVGSVVPGTGSAFNFGNFNIAGNYTVTGSNTACTGTANMTGSVDITVSTLQTWYYDGDGDGYTTTSVVACGSPGPNYILTTNGNDCNDSSPFIHNPISWFYDFDNDGYYGSTQMSCFSPGAGWLDITFGPDCNDTVAAINPDAVEIHNNGIDENCNGMADDCIAISFAITGTPAFCSGSSTILDAGTFAGYNWSTGATTQTISVSTAGTFTVTVTNANGCSGSASKITKVRALPNTAISATGATTFCNGGSVTLNAVAVANRSYQWKKGNAIIPGATFTSYVATTGGNYRIIVTNTITGCSKTSYNATIVTVNPPTAAITPQGPTTFCAGGSVVLQATAGAGLTYQWKKGNGIIGPATSQNYTATTAGTYKIIVTDVNSCSRTSAGILISVPCKEGENVQAGTGESASEMKVYPNPAHDEITVSIDVKESSDLLLQITDITGRVVFSENESSIEGLNTYQLGLNQLSKGVYMLEVKSATESWKTKVVVE